jgi:MFS family permease
MAPDDQKLNVFFSLRFGFLKDPRWDVALTVFLVALVIVGRIAAFPASIWEQDEAYLALGVGHFDPGVNHPHPPWFPLWLLMGKIIAAFGVEAAASLRILSAFFSVCMIFPLVALWSHLLERRLAVGAALLFLFLPGSWLLAGRAFTGTAATVFLVAALALWIGEGREVSSWRSFSGGILGAAAILIRPHFFPLVGVALLILTARRMLKPVAALAALLSAGLVAFSGLCFAAGGLQPLISALNKHAEYHFSRLPEASIDIGTFGLSRYLGGQMPAILWIFLTLVGILASMRTKTGWRSSVLVLAAVLGVIVLEVLTMANPAHPRYFVPIAALSCGFVLYALNLLGPRIASGAAVTAVLVSGIVITPELSTYRIQTSPPLAAMRHAVQLARAQNHILVVDRTLVSFHDYVKAGGSDFPPVVFDFQILDGSAPPPPPDYSIAVYDKDNHQFITSGPETRQFSCSSPMVRRMGQGRFLDLVVATQPVFKGWKKQSKPYIIVGN